MMGRFTEIMQSPKTRLDWRWHLAVHTLYALAVAAAIYLVGYIGLAHGAPGVVADESEYARAEIERNIAGSPPTGFALGSIRFALRACQRDSRQSFWPPAQRGPALHRAHNRPGLP